MTVQKAFGCQKRIKRKGDVLQTSDNLKILIGYCMILKNGRLWNRTTSIRSEYSPVPPYGVSSQKLTLFVKEKILITSTSVDKYE